MSAHSRIPDRVVWHRYDDFSEGDTNCVDIALVDSALLPLLTLHRVGGSGPSLAKTLVARRIQPLVISHPFTWES